jgi:hypothetical protein
VARPCDRVAPLILLKISAATGGVWVGFIIIASVVLIYTTFVKAYNKQFFNKVFSDKRMERYFSLYPDYENKAIKHYQCNLRLSETPYNSTHRKRIEIISI